MDRKAAIAQELPRLRRYARALVRDPGEADDLVQDCIARALERIAQWREGEEPRRWLFAIMHNLFIDQGRARRRRTEMAQVTAISAAEAFDPPRQLDRLHVADVLDALEALPDDRREALVLVGVEGMSYRDAAAVLGVPVGTLMSRLGRGRAQLRELIGENARRPGQLRSVE
ncbi:MAG: sigma-70 family RNA polymerase sigma factor [Hyphomicrobiales bacterium]|nr:sigma-70 family RNA polymerase sigma factor [Hyphomicrobiales bacterium]